jgi:hypothetical protein
MVCDPVSGKVVDFGGSVSRCSRGRELGRFGSRRRSILCLWHHLPSTLFVGPPYAPSVRYVFSDGHARHADLGRQRREARPRYRESQSRPKRWDLAGE